jgi:hypothetical protein
LDDLPKKVFRRLQYALAMTRKPATPPRSNCRSKLPEPGSKYADAEEGNAKTVKKAIRLVGGGKAQDVGVPLPSTMVLGRGFAAG